MTDTSKVAVRPFGRILHPTDLGSESETAFVHGLKLALAARGHLYIVNAEAARVPDDDEWAAFPGVRSTLVRWGLLEAGAPAAAVAERLSLRVTKAGIGDRNPVRGLLHFLEDDPCDLIVLATHGREGLSRMLRGSVAEPLARDAQLPTLFLPHGASGFVRTENGEIRLRHVLVPVDHAPNPSQAVSLAVEFADGLGADQAVFHLLHVGSGGPSVHVGDRHEPRVRRLERDGPVVETITRAAEEVDADLIVMATHGHEGFLDAFRGSTTEQVLRRAGRAVLAVPAA